MKYRIEPKPEFRRGKTLRFKAYLETDDVAAVKAWLANPPVEVNARVKGTDGTYYQLTTPSYHDIVVTIPTVRSDGSGENTYSTRTETTEVRTVASRETEEGCRLIERWTGKPPGSLTPRQVTMD